MLVRNLKGKAECKLNAKKKKYESIIRQSPHLIALVRNIKNKAIVKL